MTGAATGGTCGGVTTFLKEKKPDIKTYLVDPQGSGMFTYVRTGGFVKPPPGNPTSITAGQVGIHCLTNNFAKSQLDGAIRVNDQEVIEMIYYLNKYDGIQIGPSSAMNCCGAVKLARKLGPGHSIATILFDAGERYKCC